MKKKFILKILMRLVVILGIYLIIQGFIIYSDIPPKLIYKSIYSFGIDGGASLRKQTENRNFERKIVIRQTVSHVLTGLVCVIGGIGYVYLNRKNSKDLNEVKD
jgi:hypothetical protein